MKMNMRTICASLALMLFASVFAGCIKSSTTASRDDNQHFASYRDVPGVTEDEIAAIEALREQVDAFVYGMPVSTEAFKGSDGEVRGYSALLCEWLTEFFGIPFKPALYEWLDLLAGLKTGNISFSGELTATDERLKIYRMTGAIASRPLKYYRISDGRPLAEIAEERPLRCGFIEGTATINTVVSELEPGACEIVLLRDINLVYDALKSGAIDAFYYSSTAEAGFIEHNDLDAMYFYPLIYRPVSLATQDPALVPVISVVEKMLQNGGIRYLTELYNKGYEDYLRHKLYSQLTEDERSYIKNHAVIPVGADPGNYPESFYDRREKKWRGIFFDIAAEIESLTGLSFRRVNDENTEWHKIYQMLINGEAAVVPELTLSKEREDMFLWSDTSQITDYYALISRSDYRDIKVNEVLQTRVGLARDTAYAAMFTKWFPSHMNAVEYESMEEAFEALRRREVDMVMANRKRLLYLTHYLELPDYKANIVFDEAIETRLGFNRNEAVLRSIIDKAIRLIDAKGISDNWMRKTYDYRAKLAETQRPWLIGAAALLLIVFIRTTVLLKIDRGREKRLKQLVSERTKELETQTIVIKAVFDSSPDLIFCMDMNLNYLRINGSMEKHFNFLERDVIGKSDREVLKVPEDVARTIETVNRKVIDEKTTYRIEEIVPTHDGREVFFETVKIPLWQNGEVIGLLGIAHDITQSKALENELMNASQTKSAFLANMSHELRTPLNVIIGLTDLMIEEKGLSSFIKANLISVSNAGGTLLSIVNDILDISKIESGRLELVPVDYHTPSLINDTTVLLKTYIGEKPIDFKLHISENLPAMLHGDELRVKQIINNLLSNAVKYTHAGTVELRLECARDGNYIWMDISVKDSGIGIREEDLKNLFNEYYQADARTNRKTEGTGLGLPITRRMAEMMNGNVAVVSEYGKGSTFRVRLRQGFVNDATIGAEIAENLRNINYNDTKRQTSNKLVRVKLDYARVLVVDDVQNNLDVASGLMSKYKMQVDCLTGGEAAIERVRIGNPVYNAIFMDHMMPGMDGIEATKAIRALETEYARNVPIIALTANAITGAEQQFLENGFQDFLSKPIDIIQLDAILKKWVHNQAMEKSADESESLCLPDSNSEEENIFMDIPGINAKKGLSLYDGDIKIYLSVLRSYAVYTPGTLNALRGDVSIESLPNCVVTAHGLKGSSANIGAEHVRVSALELERSAANGDLNRFLILRDPCLEDVERLVENINVWFNEYDKKINKPRLKAPDREILIKLRQSCEAYNMSGIDDAMDVLESASYDTGDDLVEWLRKKIDIMDVDEVIARLSEEIL